MTNISDTTDSRPGSSERYVALARAAILWERIWPALWPASGIVAAFLALALFGVFAFVPAGLRGLIQAFVLACLGLSLQHSLRGIRRPSWTDGARRVERDSRLSHRPITEHNDRLAAGAGDDAAEALWRLHLKQLLSRIADLRVARPRSGLAARDPYALRFILLLLLLASLVVAGHDWRARLALALSPDSGESASTAAIDAWINPPAYTGEAPIYLQRGEQKTIAVPVGSELVVRVHDASAQPHFAVSPSADAPAFQGSDNEYGANYRIASGGDVRVRADGRTLGDWRIQAIPDAPPMIAFAQPPSRSERDAVKFAFTAGDDYGVVAVRALIRPVLAKGKTAAVLSVDLPLAASAKTISQTVYRDLTENPFAGLQVTITLEARDGAGQTGLSKTVPFHLPARIFTNPLARALVEQRQTLAVDAPLARQTAEETLDALTLAPDRFYQNQNGIYLALRTIYWALTDARSAADMARVEDLLWQTALSLDQAGLASAAEQLRQLQQMLSQALAQGAPQDVIDSLLQRYRDALQRYLQMLAENAQPSAGAPPGTQTLNISPDDLEKLLKAIEQAAQSGSRQSAAQMLAMLQNLLENLHMTQGAGGGGGTPGDKAMSGAIQGLSDLMGRQRELMDKTYRQQQGAGDPKDGGAKGLAEQQGKLRDDLDKALKGLGDQHMKAPDSLGRAGREMGDAQSRLGADALDGAGDSQKNALEALRQGADDLAKQLMQRMGQTGQEGNEDPLGRTPGAQGPDFGAGVKVPDRSTLERARAILQELRRRAAEQGRPKQELDYIDRLLKEF
jgi:uncharacterized protein (TIGR02302 family)